MSQSAAEFWNLARPSRAAMSARPWKRQRTRMGAGGYAARPSGFAPRWSGSRTPFKSYYKRSGRARSSAVARIWKKAANVELGGLDTDIVQAAIIATTTTNANAQCLNLIQPGNGSWNRHGRKVMLKSLRLRGVVTYIGQNVGGSYDQLRSPLRMVLVWDKQISGGAVPLYNQIFGETSQTGAETCNVLSGLRYDNTGRFRILSDTIISPPDVTPSDGAANAAVLTRIPVDLFISLRGKETVYSGETNPLTTADISSGALLIFFRALATTTDDVWSVTTGEMGARLRFEP